MGSGGEASATTLAGEFTVAPEFGKEIDNGKAHSAAGGGSIAGGNTEVLDGAVGVTAQWATFAGNPWQPFHTSKPAAMHRTVKIAVVEGLIPSRPRNTKLRIPAPRCEM